MSKFEKLDAALMANIRAGKNNFTTMQSGAARVEADRLATTNLEAFRVVDRRLQAMRKAGKIAYSHKTGWAVVPA